MKLQEFLRIGGSFSYDKIKDRELARHIQTILCWHKVLESSPDGYFGRISTYALCHFQKIHQIDEGYLGVKTAKALINRTPTQTNVLMRSLKSDFLNILIEKMKIEKYDLNTKAREINIVFVEGMNPDFTLNADTPNVFNDLCIVFDFVNCKPRVLGKWIATADPGRYYTDNPLNYLGALHHNGQERAWQVGWHKNHRALVQVLPIPITRDYNKDFRTAGDKKYKGYFGANCHGSNTNNVNDISRWSAGCKVILNMSKFKDFMRFVKGDRNYKSDNRHIFAIATIDGTSLLELVKEDIRVA